MKRALILSLFGLLLLVLPNPARAGWEIDPAHSRIGFKVRHLMVSTVSGEFRKYRATLDIDDRAIEKSSVSVTIDTASIDTGIAKRDDHLRSADFFDVAKYPDMTFVGRRITRSGSGPILLTGDLTIRGITRPVTLTVTELTQPVKDPWGGERRGASATAEINRKDFGLTWNRALETGGVVVGDQVRIEIDLELIRK